MVTINFKYTEHGIVEYPLDHPVPLLTILESLSFGDLIKKGGYIAVKNGHVTQPEEEVHDGDAIIIFPPLSGG